MFKKYSAYMAVYRLLIIGGGGGIQIPH